MTDRERTDYRARRMGFVFQSYNLMPVLTAVENVELPLLSRGSRRREARHRALETLERVGLAAPRRPRARRAVRRRAPARDDRPCARRTTRRSSGPTSRRATSTAQNADQIMALLRGLNRERGPDDADRHARPRRRRARPIASCGCATASSSPSRRAGRGAAARHRVRRTLMRALFGIPIGRARARPVARARPRARGRRGARAAQPRVPPARAAQCCAPPRPRGC